MNAHYLEWLAFRGLCMLNEAGCYKPAYDFYRWHWDRLGGLFGPTES